MRAQRRPAVSDVSDGFCFPCVCLRRCCGNYLSVKVVGRYRQERESTVQKTDYTASRQWRETRDGDASCGPRAPWSASCAAKEASESVNAARQAARLAGKSLGLRDNCLFSWMRGVSTAVSMDSVWRAMRFALPCAEVSCDGWTQQKRGTASQAILISRSKNTLEK